MIEVSILISSLVANFITRFVKPPKVHLTQNQLVDRKYQIRVLNAVFGLVVLVVSYSLTGGELDMDQVSTYVEIIFGFLITFLTSQGFYFLPKEW